MSTAITPPHRFATVADLLQQLGDIPPDRVRLDPWPAAEEDVIEVGAREGRPCELVDGVLVEKAMGFLESWLAAILIRELGAYLKEHDLGIVAGADGPLRLAAGLVRIPDVSFLSWDRLPEGRVPREPIPALAPDLAVEVLSRGNTPRETERKLREYFAAGVRLVWLIDPATRTALAHTAPDRAAHLTEADSLNGADVLPGFRLPLRDLFAHANRPEPN